MRGAAGACRAAGRNPGRAGSSAAAGLRAAAASGRTCRPAAHAAQHRSVQRHVQLTSSRSCATCRCSPSALDSSGAFTVTLADGQVWKQSDEDEVYHPARWRRPASEMLVTIAPDAMHTFILTVAGETASIKCAASADGLYKQKGPASRDAGPFLLRLRGVTCRAVRAGRSAAWPCNGPHYRPRRQWGWYPWAAACPPPTRADARGRSGACSCSCTSSFITSNMSLSPSSGKTSV